jgi:hypothetical protein
VIKVTAKADFRGAKLFVEAVDKAGQRASARALNRTMTTVRAEAARLIQQKRDLPIGEIKKSMQVQRATAHNLIAVLKVSGRPISMRHFANGGKRGVTVRIEKGSKRTLLTRYGNKAFINPVWRPGVFVRKGKSRLPIVSWPPVPGLPTVLLQEQVYGALKALASRAFESRIGAELNYELSVMRKRFGVGGNA